MTSRDITAVLREHWNFRLSEGVHLELGEEPLDYSYSGAMKNGIIVLPDPELDQVRIGYVVDDEAPGDFWSNHDDGIFREFSRDESPRDIHEEMKDQIPPPLPGPGIQARRLPFLSG